MNTSIIRFFLPIFFLLLPGSVYANPDQRAMELMFQRGDEVVLDGQVDFTSQGVVMFAKGNKRMIFLDGVVASGKPGRQIMVVGYPYKKGDNYHINVTGYTFLEH